MYECLPISVSKNNFLKHDSNISCNFAFNHDDAELNSAEYIGRLSANDLKQLYEFVRDNVRRLTKADKDMILKAIYDAILDDS